MSHAVLTRSAAGRVRRWGEQRDPTDLADTGVCAEAARELAAGGLLELPPPGAGDTLGRFEALAALGEFDLGLARLAEGHVDAVAILRELGSAELPGSAGALWGVWAADPPGEGCSADLDRGRWRLSGTKRWCSGAHGCTHALVTAHAGDGYRLFAVDLTEAGVAPLDDWEAFALAGTDSGSVRFETVPAEPVGAPNAYLDRPGFWHGGAGVACVWLGGAEAVAETLRAACRRRGRDEHALAHAGAVDVALHAAWAVVTAAAGAIDADPADARGEAMVRALRARAVVEQSATAVLDRVGRALGAGPLARHRHGRRVADLTFYLRQSHAERDLAALGEHVCGPVP